MSTCPAGHETTATDYCDTCGTPLAAPVVAPPAAAPPAAAPEMVCPNCGAARTPDDAFCEGCGLDFATGQMPVAPPPPMNTEFGAKTPESPASSPRLAAA